MKKRAETDTVVRFGATERLFHWALGLPYLTLLASGALLWAQRAAGFTLVATPTLVRVHLVAAGLLGAGVLLVFVGGDRRALLRNAGLALRWGLRDLAWLLLFPLHALVPRVPVPPSGKFNAGQKLNLLAHMVLLPVLAASGVAMWLRPGALLSWYVHVGAFAVAAALVAGHVYLAVVHRSTRKGLRGIVTGRVDAEWAREHHPLEYGAGDAAGAPRETAGR